MALGSLLAPQRSIRPEPRPDYLTKDITGAPVQARQERAFANPMLQAFMLNMANGLLGGQQGIAEAAGTGLGGMGRFAVSEQQRRDKEEAEAKAAAARRSSGGGGGSSSGGTGQEGDFFKNVDPKKYNTAYAKALKELMEDETLTGASPEKLKGIAHMKAMLEFGEVDAILQYQSLPPEQQDAFAQIYSNGPNAARTTIEGIRKQAALEAENMNKQPTVDGSNPAGLPAIPPNGIAAPALPSQGTGVSVAPPAMPSVGGGIDPNLPAQANPPMQQEISEEDYVKQLLEQEQNRTLQWGVRNNMWWNQ